MLENLFKSLIMHPKSTLILFKNYGNLVVKDYVNTFSRFKMRLFLFALSVAFFILGLSTLFGVVLLWAALPVLNPRNDWMLIFLPSSLIVARVSLYITATSYKIQPNLKMLHQKLRLDLKSICRPTKQE